MRILPPIEVDPAPTPEQLRSRLLCTLGSIETVLALVDAFPAPQLTLAAEALNRYATPLICAMLALQPAAPRPTPTEPA